MPYKKYGPGDELEKGVRIRLAGREGVIINVFPFINLYVQWEIAWDSGDEESALNLSRFPDLEIFVQPLTIPQRTKQIVLEKYLDPKINYEMFRAFLYSLEVTSD